MLKSTCALCFLLANVGCAETFTCDLDRPAAVGVTLVDDAGAAVTDADVAFVLDDGDSLPCTGDRDAYACGDAPGTYVITASRNNTSIGTGTIDVDIDGDADPRCERPASTTLEITVTP